MIISGTSAVSRASKSVSLSGFAGISIRSAESLWRNEDVEFIWLASREYFELCLLPNGQMSMGPVAISKINALKT